jgi:hypothetical protein
MQLYELSQSSFYVAEVRPTTIRIFYSIPFDSRRIELYYNIWQTLAPVFLSQAAHLIELAAIIGKPELTAHLAAREVEMRALIIANMWDDGRQVFANKYPPGTAPHTAGASTPEVRSPFVPFSFSLCLSVSLSLLLSHLRLALVISLLAEQLRPQCWCWGPAAAGVQHQDFPHLLLSPHGERLHGRPGHGDGDPLAH